MNFYNTSEPGEYGNKKDHDNNNNNNNNVHVDNVKNNVKVCPGTKSSITMSELKKKISYFGYERHKLQNYRAGNTKALMEKEERLKHDQQFYSEVRGEMKEEGCGCGGGGG